MARHRTVEKKLARNELLFIGGLATLRVRQIQPPALGVVAGESVVLEKRSRKRFWMSLPGTRDPLSITVSPNGDHLTVKVRNVSGIRITAGKGGAVTKRHSRRTHSPA